MPHRPFAELIQDLRRLGAKHPSTVEPHLIHPADRRDRLGWFLGATPSRRSAVRLFTSAAVAALASWPGSNETEAHNLLKKCKKLKRKPARKRCIKRAKAHNAIHRRKPNASCLEDGNGQSTTASGRFAQTFTEPNGGKLASAKVRCFRGVALTGDFHLAVNTVDSATGTPTNITLASSEPVPASTVGQSPTMVTFKFPVPEKLVANRQYALVLARSVSAEFGISYQEPSTCAGGARYFSASSLGVFGPIFGDPSDMIYETFVTP